MKFLLDVNVLVAWGWANHTGHDQVTQWLSRMKQTSGNFFLTSAIPELGFVRVSGHRSVGLISPEEAGRVLSGMLQTLGQQHVFLPDDQSATQWPAWCQTANHTTDAHLLVLAQAHGAELATLDQGIPGAYLIP